MCNHVHFIYILCTVYTKLNTYSNINILIVHIFSEEEHNLEGQEQYLCIPLNCDELKLCF